MINNIINILTNSRNKIEGQRLKEQWFLKRGYSKEWAFLTQHNINSCSTLYQFINNITDKCECGNTKRFKSFAAGFVDHCEQCSRTKYNNMTLLKSNRSMSDLPRDTQFKYREELKSILKGCQLESGKFSTAKILKCNIKDKIIASTYYLSPDKKISERIYHIMNDLRGTVKCTDCGCELDTFFSNVSGYRSMFCKKNKCGYKHVDKSASEKTLLKLYTEYMEKYNSLITSDYTFTFPEFNEFMESRGDSRITFTHINCNQTFNRPIKYQGRLDCPFCFPQRSKYEIQIIQYLQEITRDANNVVSDDRSLIYPKEIDVVYKNLAIEFDGQKYHSFGKSTDSRFNNFEMENKNIHVEKTDLLPEHMQLLRIFSSEWINPTKQEIWKSIIASHVNRPKNTIYARKCEIKEVDTKTEKEFLNCNHLQGFTPSGIRLGLFYKDQLVYIMTFIKSRFNKAAEYELLRAAPKIFHNIPGGFSRLLTYFERKYSPTSIISYANRRLSKGNVYNKNGFTFTKNTKPGYFYIQGNNFDAASLESRIAYQKHKLKMLLPLFDENLTETENMYNNNYRKIYDCGHMVFLKNIAL